MPGAGREDYIPKSIQASDVVDVPDRFLPVQTHQRSHSEKNIAYVVDGKGEKR